MSPNGRLSQPTTVHSDRLSHTPFIEVVRAKWVGEVRGEAPQGPPGNNKHRAPLREPRSVRKSDRICFTGSARQHWQGW